jgi:hypothetical protein
MEFITGFFVGYLANTIGIISLLIAALLFDILEATKTTVFLLIAAFISAYLFFGVPINVLISAAIFYLTAGVFWSVWRYRRYVNSRMKAVAEYSTASARKDAIRELAPKYHTNKILYWMFVWPISAINSLIGDVIRMAITFVNTFFKNVYEALYQSAIDKHIPKEAE